MRISSWTLAGRTVAVAGVLIDLSQASDQQMQGTPTNEEVCPGVSVPNLPLVCSFDRPAI